MSGYVMELGMLNVDISHSQFCFASSMDFCDIYSTPPMSPSATSTIYHYNFAGEQQFPTVSDCIDEDAVAENMQLGQIPISSQSTQIVLDLPPDASNDQIEDSVSFYTNQQSSFSSVCSQFPSSSCNLLPYSSHCQFEHFKPAAVPLIKNVRRPNWTCPECRRRFDHSEQFQKHFEPCWVNAVARELQQQNMEKGETPILEKDYQMPMVQPYRFGVSGEELHFDGEPSLLRSKSGRISLFVSLESQTKAKMDSFNGKTKRTAIAKQTGSNYGEKIASNSEEFAEKDAITKTKSIFEKVECPVCGKRLFRHNLHVHHRIHTGELPFPCVFCSKRFRTSSARRVHHRSHTGEKPYLCSFCQYACTTKRNLERHMHSRHLSTHAITHERQQRKIKRNDITDIKAIEDAFTNECFLYARQF